MADPRSKNGVRLVGGSGPRGRLEVSSVDGWLTNYEEGVVAWRPVCNTGFFDDSLAQVACEMLGYAYGRKHYTAEVAFRAPNATAKWPDNPIDYLYCSPVSSAPPEGGQLEGGHRRRLHAPLKGTVNTPEESPYTCGFRKGECDYAGPMAGVECSDEEFPPAPPPPPTPPSPPDRPPTFQNDIQQIGGNYDIESNLCEGSEDPDCPYLARGELLVADPADPSGKVWAPICAPPDQELAAKVADLACKQLVDWPYTPGLFSARGDAGTPFMIPAEPEAGAEGVFRPSSYTAWATVTGGDANGKKAVQELNLQVTTEPCSDGLLLSYQCTYRA